MLKRVEKKRGGAEPIPFESKYVKNERGGVEPILFALKRVEKEQGGAEPTPFVSKHVENEWVGLNDPKARANVMKNMVTQPPRVPLSLFSVYKLRLDPRLHLFGSSELSGLGFVISLTNNSQGVMHNMIFATTRLTEK